MTRSARAAGSRGAARRRDAGDRVVDRSSRDDVARLDVPPHGLHDQPAALAGDAVLSGIHLRNRRHAHRAETDQFHHRGHRVRRELAAAGAGAGAGRDRAPALALGASVAEVRERSRPAAAVHESLRSRRSCAASSIRKILRSAHRHFNFVRSTVQGRIVRFWTPRRRYAYTTIPAKSTNSRTNRHSRLRCGIYSLQFISGLLSLFELFFRGIGRIYAR